MKKYTYSLNIRPFINNLRKHFTDQCLNVDERYLTHYNICPYCKKEFKTYRDEITKVATISAFIPNNSNTAVLYALCTNCIESMNKNQYSSTKGNDGIIIEDFIYEKFPDLTPSKKGYSADELEEVTKILRMDR